jgi:D-psicose/D-tagatose/L-ribulose 3-epimerase
MMKQQATIKFGAHQFLWKSHWTDGDLPILDTVRRLGLTLFEVSIGDDVQFDRRRLGKYAASLGVELTVGPGNLWPMDCDISDEDAGHRRLGMDWHKKVIAEAAELGAAAYCGALYGHPGRLSRRRPLQDELLRTAENLHILADYAAGIGVRLAIEPMNRYRTHLVNTAQQAVTLVRAASHPNLAINLDTYHMITEERDYGTAVRRALPVLWGLHACENDRGVPGGGIVPWPAVFDALADAESCVRLMLETYNTGASDFGFSRGIFQDLCPDAEQFVRQGVGFLQDCFVAAAEKRQAAR